MILPGMPLNEQARVADLHTYHILDSGPDPLFDDVAELAAKICGVDYSIINLIDADRHWLKSVHGLEGLQEIPREIGFCSHVIVQDWFMEVPDLALDPRFCDNPFVTQPPHFRFYAGMPLINEKGHALGTLIVLETEPRQLTEWQREALNKLAEIVVALLESRKLENEKRQRDARFAMILDNSLDAYVTMEADGRIVEWNVQAEKIFGWSKEEALGQPVSQTIIPIHARSAHEEGLERFLATGEQVILNRRVEVTAIRKNGDEFPIELSITPIGTEHGWVFSASIRDITERQQMETVLRESEERFRTTFEQAAVGIAHVKLDWEVLAANRQFWKILGFSPGGHDSFNLMAGSHAEERGKSLEQAQQLLEGEVSTYSMEKRLLRRNRTAVWVNMTVSLCRDASSGAPQYFIVVIEDITQRKKIEESLHQAEEHFRLLVEGTEDYAILRLDAYGNVASWNPGAEKTLGYREDEIVGEHFSRFYTLEDSMSGLPQRKLSQAIREGRAENDRWHVRRDGSRFWGTGVINTLYDEAGNIQGFVKIMRDNTVHKLAQDRTCYLANHDTLTGLPNRACFSDRLHETIAHAQREMAGFALLMLDLDRFKSVNDSLGHDVGDLLLKEVAARLLGCVRETDTVARLGGDEFVVIQTTVMESADARILADKIVAELGKPYRLNGQVVHSGTSIGITLYPRDGRDAGQLLKNADLALYQAKDLGRHNYQFFDDSLQLKLLNRQKMEQGLYQALQNQELRLYYQPQINLDTWQVEGVEALLRWRNPELQMLGPNDFLQVAHESGLLIPIGQWALREACRQAKAWQEAGIPTFRIGVNFSVRQLEDARFLDMVREVLGETGLDPKCLEIEITDGQAIKDRDKVIGLMQALQGLNINIAADDFGAGLSSLNALKRYPIDTLKIHQTVIEHVPYNRQDAAIASSLIRLGQDLDIRIVAEGVETTDQLAFLAERGGVAAQGFLFSPPVSAKSLETLLLQGNWTRINSAQGA